MATIVELISATDTIAFHPTPIGEGWVYDNDTLDAWYALAEVETKLTKRPNAHGTYNPGQLFTKEARPLVVGQYYGATAADALRARNRLNALFSEGRPITMRVTDELGTTTREVLLVEASTDFRYNFSHFPFDLSLVAPDPRRYGPPVVDTDTMPTEGSGLIWDLGTAPSGLYFDWGTEGNPGQVSFFNLGSATTFPTITVGGPGAFTAGFRITEIETGNELTYPRATSTGATVIFNSRTKRATLAAGDVTGLLSSRDWFSIPPGAMRRYQITPLGPTTGTPTITLTAAPADL